MSKKMFLAPFLVLAMFAGGVASAQTGAAQLPSAGLTPGSALYFLDTLGESLREFFTLNPEGKARLQIVFAAERVAEIKVILETKGVDAQGLAVAQAKLQANLERANAILAARKADGQDVSALAKELDDDLDSPRSALKEAFKAEKRALEAKEKELEAKLRAARQAGDAAQAEALRKELSALEAQQELLETKFEEQEEAMEREEERLENEMEDEDEAAEDLEDAAEKQRELNEDREEENERAIEGRER